MAFVWLCATPCRATGAVTEVVTGSVTVPAPARAPAPVGVSLEVSLPALRGGAVALVLAVAVVAGLSAGDARALGAAVAPDSTPSASPAPDLRVHGGERPVPGRRDLA